MRIGIEATAAIRARRGGIGRYVAELSRSLQSETSQHQVEAIYSARRILRRPHRVAGVKPNWYRRSAVLSGIDLLHCTNGFFPESESAVRVATVHDFYHLSPQFLGRRPEPQEIQQYCTYIRQADHVICVSQATRQALHQYLEWPESRSHVIPLGVSEQFRRVCAEDVERVKQHRDLPERFLLFLGRMRPNKNLERLIKAHQMSNCQLPLVLVGAFDRKQKEVIVSMSHHSNSQVILRNFVPDDELPALLSAASGLCFPSTYEGFGLPILEAMACGTAVLTACGGATEEVAGGDAILVDPWSVESIADGMSQLVNVPVGQRLRAAKRAAEFTWSRSAKSTLAVYEAALLDARRDPIVMKSPQSMGGKVFLAQPAGGSS